MKKTIVTILLGLSLVSFRYDELKDLQNYKTTKFQEEDKFINNLPIRLRMYDVRKSGTNDVAEYYFIREDKNHRRYVDNPFIYVFDINNNGLVDREEMLIDEKQDGLNGNEYWRK